MAILMNKGTIKTRNVKRRTYNTRLIRRDFCYRLDEVAELYGLHRQTVRQWLRGGLRRIDDRRPILINGGDLINFLNARQSKRKQACAPDEFYCCRCREPQRAHHNLVSFAIKSNAKLMLSANCSKCGTRMHRFGSVQKLDHYHSAFIIQTSAEARLKVRSEPVVISHLDEEKRNAQLQPQE
jgi:transcription elongation factor Elf1